MFETQAHKISVETMHAGARAPLYMACSVLGGSAALHSYENKEISVYDTLSPKYVLSNSVYPPSTKIFIIGRPQRLENPSLAE